jgi:hypothetical protein
VDVGAAVGDRGARMVWRLVAVVAAAAVEALM